MARLFFVCDLRYLERGMDGAPRCAGCALIDRFHSVFFGSQVACGGVPATLAMVVFINCPLASFFVLFA
jgi:hypothetical protein